MEKYKKHGKIIIAFLICVICWGTIITVDYALCQAGKPPVFSIERPVTDQNRYFGLGYTIVLRYKGPIGMNGEKLKGYFYWGWR